MFYGNKMKTKYSNKCVIGMIYDSILKYPYQNNLEISKSGTSIFIKYRYKKRKLIVAGVITPERIELFLELPNTFTKYLEDMLKNIPGFYKFINYYDFKTPKLKDYLEKHLK